MQFVLSRYSLPSGRNTIVGVLTAEVRSLFADIEPLPQELLAILRRLESKPMDKSIAVARKVQRHLGARSAYRTPRSLRLPNMAAVAIASRKAAGDRRDDAFWRRQSIGNGGAVRVPADSPVGALPGRQRY
jgi:hypothetical protein